MNEPAHARPILELSGYLPLIHLGKDLDLPTYFVVISMSLIICVLWLVRRAQAREMNRVVALDFALITMISGFLGARIFHIIFEEPEYYLQAPSRVFEVWRGGFVWYGGTILSFSGCALYAKVKKVEILPWLDLFAPICALGYTLGRVACWLTGCCYGKVCVLDIGFSFRHPTQIYAVVCELFTLGILLLLEKRPRFQRGVFFVWMILHGVGRIVMEAFRDDPRGPEPLGLSLSTWISLALIAVGGFAMWRTKTQCFTQKA